MTVTKIAKSIIVIALSYFFFLGQTIAIAQSTAAILPQGKTQFLDNNGKPLTSGKVFYYVPSTTTTKTTWQDSAKTIANANPVVLDAGGRAIIYGDGTYRQLVRDRNNNTIWDAVTASAGTGGGTTGTGDGDLVGTIKPWAGLTAPNQYAFAYGQELSRTTFASLYTAITLQQTITCVSANATASGFSDTTQIPTGAVVESTCFAAGTTVVSKTATTVTFSANSSISTTETIRLFLYGAGNGSTTFNVPDLRGNTVVGRCNMGGTNCSNLTSTYFGVNPQATGAVGGTQSKTLLTANLPAYTPAGTVTAAGTISQITPAGTNSTSALTGGTTAAVPIFPTGAGGGAVRFFSDTATGVTATIAVTGTAAAQTFTGTPVTPTFTNSGSTFGGTAQGGVSTAFSIVQPGMTLNYIIKITPDTNSADASGVTSIASMTGDIACGSGLLCTGNIISVVPSSSTAAATTIYGNPTAATTTPSFFSVTGLTNQAAPNATNDYVLLYNAASTTFQKATVGSIAAAATAGVASLGGMTGALLCGGDLLCSGSTISRSGPTVNVITIGAVGNSNGTTGNGTNNTTVFQTAFDTTGSTVGGAEYRTIYIPCGTYRITDTIVGNDDNVAYRIVGEGQCSQIYLDAASGRPAFSFTSPSTSCGGNNTILPCITVERLYFVNPTTPSASTAVLFAANVGTRFANNIVHIYGTGVKYTTSYGGEIQNNTFLGTGGPAIDLTTDNSGNIFRIWSNGIYGSGSSNSDFAIKIGPGSGTTCENSTGAISVIGNDISYGFGGILLRGVCSGSFEKNYIEGNTSAPFYAANPSGGFNSAINITNNWISGNANFDIYDITGLKIENNTIRSNNVGFGTGITALTLGYNRLESATLQRNCSPTSNCTYLNSGYVLQWGTSATSAATPGVVTVTFPIACQTAPNAAQVTAGEESALYKTGWGSLTTTGMNIYSETGPVTTSWQIVCR